MATTDTGPDICACCDEAWEGYAARHPLDPQATERWRYRGSGRWNCPFCYDVCRSLDLHNAYPKGSVHTYQAEASS